MLKSIIILLVIVWLIGLLTSYTMSGFIQALIAVALLIVMIRVFQGRKILD